MKFGIVSDIHANLAALQAVLSLLRAQGATRFICLGDIVGYGPDPNACIEAVRELRGHVVAGNHDLGAVGRTPTADFNTPAQSALDWTRKQLTRDNRLYLEGLPLTDTCDVLRLVHASPSAPDQWEYLFTLREAEDEIDSFDEPVCLVGHTHYPFAVERQRGGDCRLVRHEIFELRPGTKYVINAGSVGQPRDGNPRACCLLFDSHAGTMSFLRAEYDVAATQQKIRDAGLPEFLATRLSTGH